MALLNISYNTRRQTAIASKANRGSVEGCVFACHLVEFDHVFHHKDPVVSTVLIHNVVRGTIAHARAV